MGFEDLDVWKKSARLSVNLYRELRGLDDYGFRDQITRSGLSIPSNVSEGHERTSVRDNLKFLGYAKGSCGELRTQIYIGMEIGYINAETARQWLKETEAIAAMLGGLIRSKQKLLEEKNVNRQ